MKTNDKIINLVESGFKVSFLINLSEGQLDTLHNKLMEIKKEVKEQTAPTPSLNPTTKTVQQYNVPANYKGKIATGGKDVMVSTEGGKTTVIPVEEMKEDDVDVINPFKGKQTQSPKQVGPSSDDGFEDAQDGMDILETDLDEKSVSQQQQKLMGLALSVKKGKTPKSKVSKKVKDVAKSMSEKDLEDFASTKHKGLPKKVESKENYMDMVGKGYNNLTKEKVSKMTINPVYEELEKEISKMVESHIPAKISKKELLNLLEAWEEEDDVIVKPSKPTTKPGPTIDPDDPYQPAPDVEPVPRAGEEDDDVIVKPKRPITKPGPTIDPDDPYQPAPDVEPVPRADKEKLPKWFSFDELGLQFKK